MTACMVGSAITGLLMKRVAVESYMVTVFGISALSMVVPFVFHLDHRNPNSAPPYRPTRAEFHAGQFQLIAFCLFEGCVGIFWPSMMSMRARYVPEDDVRLTVINLFRIPLNQLLCLMLLKVSDFPLSVMFALCCALLGSCMLCQMALNVFIAGEAAELLEKQNSSCPHGTGGDIYATAKVSSAMKVSNSSGSLGGDTKLAVNVPHQRPAEQLEEPIGSSPLKNGDAGVSTFHKSLISNGGVGGDPNPVAAEQSEEHIDSCPLENGDA
eukprot:gene5111-34913_t